MGAFLGFFRPRSSLDFYLYEELDWKELEQEYQQKCCELHADNEQPDWADILAKQWIETIRQIYKGKEMPKEGFSTEIVKLTGKELSTAVDRGFEMAGDYDAIDEIPRQILKENVWKFSVAKNYNDCVRLNNLLLRPDGSIRSWSEFKREAMKVVGTSNRYLKTEYDTIIAGAMMSRKWQDIQRDKYIFPFVQFKVVQDNRTSEICSPLHNIICKVDDPFLAHYFPPNHFNCRTDVIKLRDAEPTPQKELPYIDIPKAFLNNVGETGEIFTEENSYIKNTPKEVLNKAKHYHDRNEVFEKYKNNPEYYDVEMNALGGVKATHKDHNFDKRTGVFEKHIQNLFFERGDIFTLESENPQIEGKKIDGYFNDNSHDISVIIGNGNNTIKRALNHSREKKAEVAILYFDDKETFDFEWLKQGIKKYNGQTDYRFKYIIYIIENEIFYY